ncbi:sensor histidine kinase [Mycolicibacterium arenosum]|uniref:histidine kinase n=1 Tax=Mycolicibacterium arenosum TaxID=2952157 RepID=A0ABT1LWW8_9MYCO|nr:HAMP domain-containing sensor histidine kinase [Mycolicibacterium sp. CAU 1645]MCP9270982.1 HAMP domain-containing histidine kinase [Mycolicibacterium sp. CAU 1645]
MTRSRLPLSLAAAAGAGTLASLAVVVVLTRRSIRPLAQALDTQRRFVADVSHELRAPLTILHTRAQLVAREAVATGQVDLAAEASRLADDTRALRDVIDDLLESATTIHPGSRGGVVDLASVVDEVRRSMAGIAEAGEVELTVDRREGAFDVWGSGSALRRALVALVDNALAHQKPGGTVVLRLSGSARDVSVAVVDDGYGLDANAVGSLFTRFTTGEDITETVERRSHGIGLALVREIARSHGGDVRFTETPGGGATFTLTLPALR